MTIDELREQCVFRYRVMNKNTMKEALNSEIWHSTIEGLNDPFEFPTRINWDELEKKDAATLTKYARFFSILPDEEITYYIVRQQLELLYEIIKTSLESSKKAFYDYSESLIVACFSNNLTSPLMWSHYSDGMKGLCIAYNRKVLEASDSFLLQPVVYNKTPFTFDYKDLMHIPAVDEFKFYNYEKNEESVSKGFLVRLNSYHYLYQKHDRWEYEGELRNIIDPNSSKSEFTSGKLIEFPNDSISAIIIGYKMTAIHQKLVAKYCALHNIPIFMASPNFSDYSVRVKAL
ncbi:DUF2971 domain-containing protein [Vibrio antiquarius]|uniref:DUF2971 domain-containing protein n=1 Tax=Vibrio antiquarius (strain Ex25) TaxID=150340 RepID=UPI0026598FFF|nr:DUF2971 domain-containing protein [Vibrio antiquarius]MCR9850337.1 DUF2971 domain-containing protein [Vibrio antiquarius]MCR9913208.1 DUF2971 domain-containing protein [Vibrio antiquarius]